MISRIARNYLFFLGLFVSISSHAHAWQPLTLAPLFNARQHVVLDLGLFSAYQGEAQHK